MQDLDRLAADMHADIDEFARMALDNKDAEDREAAIRVAMEEHLVGRLADHGFKGDRDTMRSVLAIDIVLNAQGLVSWLARLERQNG